jgi:hypothetical protein
VQVCVSVYVHMRVFVSVCVHVCVCLEILFYTHNSTLGKVN